MTQLLRHHISLWAIFALGFAVLLSPFTSWADETAQKAVSVIHVDAQQARDLLQQNPKFVVLDVRTKGEYIKGHIEGAVRNNYFSTKFKKRLRALDKSAAYIVHCKSGHRSKRVVKIMKKEGFQNIYHMDGGYGAWKKLPPKTD